MKRICVVTVSRADYGLLSFVAKAISDSPFLELQMLATGAHFSEDQGNTSAEIASDGLVVTAEVPMAPRRTTAIEVTSALGFGLSELGKVLGELKPDCVVLLGDRAETLVAAVASTIASIPIAHIHGGEITSGAVDDAFRHSITKMSSLHFVAHEQYRNRVLQLGEESKSVFLVGPLGAESVARRRFQSREDLESTLGITFGQRNLLVTVHPETLYPENNEELVSSLLVGLSNLENVHLFFTAANTDVGGDFINRKIREYCDRNEHTWYFDSLGADRYLSMMALVDAVVGNSSSGFFEAPALGIPTVDIGHRQDGRVAADSIRRVPADWRQIGGALEDLLADPIPPIRLRHADFDGSSWPSQVITQALETVDFGSLMQKKFVDFDFLNEVSTN